MSENPGTGSRRIFFRLSGLEDRKSLLSDKAFIWVAVLCLVPVVLNVLGVDFGFLSREFDPYQVTRFIQTEQDTNIGLILRGRYVHLIFVSVSITISLLTIVLAVVDFRIKGDISTPIVAFALFCSGIFNTFHLLVATELIRAESEQFYLTSFTWFFSRLFHSAILVLGTGIFLIRKKGFGGSGARQARNTIVFTALFFVLLTVAIILVLFINSKVPQDLYPFSNQARSYDLIPLFLYALLGLILLPRFYEKYPSVFARTLQISMIPAIASQLYMAFGSTELFDNCFNISHVMTAFSYFIPFYGICLNYLQTWKSEQEVIGQLHEEAVEREQAEALLSGVLNSSANSIMAFRVIRDTEKEIQDFEWLLANPSTNALLGIDQRKITGVRLFETLPDLEGEGWFDFFTRVLQAGDTCYLEYYSDCYKKWFYLTGVPVQDGLAITLSDISRRINAQQALMRAEKLAVTGNLARTIAHEVRNPLTNINLSVEQAQAGRGEDADLNSCFDIIRRNSGRIEQLISDLLESSRPGLLKPQEYSICNITDAALELADDRRKLKNISLHKNYPSDDWKVFVDPVMIRTALLNIFINGIEAMEPDRGQLEVIIGTDLDKILVTISDNGSGIAPGHLDRMFEPFFTGKTKGMGLGLTAAHNMIVNNHGTIDVRSELGKGTTFLIRFPKV